MKALLLMIALMALLAAGCGEMNPAQPTATGPVQSTSQTPWTVPPLPRVVYEPQGLVSAEPDQAVVKPRKPKRQPPPPPNSGVVYPDPIVYPDN